MCAWKLDFSCLLPPPPSSLSVPSPLPPPHSCCLLRALGGQLIYLHCRVMEHIPADTHTHTDTLSPLSLSLSGDEDKQQTTRGWCVFACVYVCVCVKNCRYTKKNPDNSSPTVPRNSYARARGGGRARNLVRNPAICTAGF